jgi:hypothetical protein
MAEIIHQVPIVEWDISKMNEKLLLRENGTKDIHENEDGFAEF